MKKIIAFVLTVAMVLSVCAFSVSAETAPAIVLEGAGKVVVGDDYTVSVRINNAAAVAGVQGELSWSGATVKDVVVNPELKTWNNTEDTNTVVYNDGDSINFATLIGDVSTRILVKVTFNVTADPAFTLANVKFADDNAAPLTGTSANLDPALVNTEAGVAKLNAVGMLPEADGLKQGVVVNGTIDAEGVKEFGVVYYPTQLLNGAALTKDTAGAVVASTSDLTNIADFDATLKFSYTDAAKAAKMLGIKISSVVYYIDANDDVHYSANSVDKYIQGGAASKAILNVALDKVAGITGDSELDDAIAGISGADMINCRNTILAKAIEAAANAQ